MEICKEYDMERIKGYPLLSEMQAELFRAFLSNFHLFCEQEQQIIMKPISIYFVEMVDCVQRNVGKELVGEKFFYYSGRRKKLLSKCIFCPEIPETEWEEAHYEEFLRYDYKLGSRAKWLSIFSPTRWCERCI